MPLAVGLISGTSADGVTAVLARLSQEGVRVLRCRTFPYSPSLRRRVLGAAALSAPEISQLNFKLGGIFAEAAQRIARGAKPAVVGSHGQTVWHGPRATPPNTLQIGEPAMIAERLNIPVVADFRPRDVASGGEGAPLVPAFDKFLFANGPWRAVLNIGGIANVSFVGHGKLHSAFDTGPGNSLLDLAVGIATGGRRTMDRGGRIASKGSADSSKLDAMLRHPYFHRHPPKSLDRAGFGVDFLRRHFGRVSLRNLPDVLATLSALTTRSIAHAVLAFAPERIREVIVSGGGALNPEIMRRLKIQLAPAPVAASDLYGLPVMSKEAACFAWLAWRAINGRPNNCPAATGARGQRILGKIIPA